MLKNRAPRCDHGFYVGLCAVVGCQHFDGGQSPEARAPAVDHVKPSYRGASEAVRSALLETPKATVREIATRCACSTSLVGLVRTQLGMPRLRKPRR